MAWRGSFARSLVSSVRASTLRSSPPLPCLRPPPLSGPRRLSFSNPRTMGELGCAQSLLQLHSVVAETRLTSHLVVNAGAFSKLFYGLDVGS